MQSVLQNVWNVKLKNTRVDSHVPGRYASRESSRPLLSSCLEYPISDKKLEHRAKTLNYTNQTAKDNDLDIVP